MEHVCYLFLLNLEHVRYLSWVINMYIVRMDGRTDGRMYVHTERAYVHTYSISLPFCARVARSTQNGTKILYSPAFLAN
jgi:hypothetical protein